MSNKYEKELVKNRTKTGLIHKIFYRQTNSSKSRGMDAPDYTKEALETWALGQPLFHELYKEWVNNNYTKDLRPSVDRLDDTVSYKFSNIQLMTWKENRLKASDSRKSLGDGATKQVQQLMLTGELVETFISTMAAFRKTGVRSSNISLVATGKRKTAGGYLWRYV